MPKISHPLSESERILFHANYKYMWDKISTTYFAVLRSKTPPSAKIDEKKLPSYAICAKCNNDESYAPSRATIAKIVDFYNSQIRPPVEVYQFTHERLEDSDNIRYRSSSVFDPRFIGTYRGYYPSVTEDVVIGSYLIIFEEDARLIATLIMAPDLEHSFLKSGSLIRSSESSIVIFLQADNATATMRVLSS